MKPWIRFSALLGLCVVLAGCAETSTDVSGDAGASAQPGASTTSSDSTATDQAAPADSGASHDITIEVVDAEGYRKALERHKGKVVFVDFWATYCPPCMEQFEHTVHLSRAFPNDEVAVISMSMDDPGDQAAALEFLQKKGATFDNLLSQYGIGVESMEKFEIDTLPTYKIYGRNGELVKRIDNDAEVEMTFESLEAEVRKALEVR